MFNVVSSTTLNLNVLGNPSSYGLLLYCRDVTEKTQNANYSTMGKVRENSPCAIVTLLNFLNGSSPILSIVGPERKGIPITDRNSKPT